MKGGGRRSIGEQCWGTVRPRLSPTSLPAKALCPVVALSGLHVVQYTVRFEDEGDMAFSDVRVSIALRLEAEMSAYDPKRTSVVMHSVCRFWE